MVTIQRRGLFLVVAVAIVLAFDRPADFTTTTGRGWQVFVYILGLLLLAAAGVVLVLAAAPPTFVQLVQERRERLLFFGFALLVGAMLTIVLLRAYATYYLHRHGLPT